MRSYKRIVIGVAAAALLVVGNSGCAEKQPPGPDPWVTAGQQANAAASRADAAAGRAEAAAGRAEAAAGRTEAAAKRVEDAATRVESSQKRSMRK